MNKKDWNGFQKDKRRRSFIFFFWRNRKPAKNAESIGSKTINREIDFNFQSGKKIERDFKIKNINLEIPREELYKRINNRVDEMMHAGLLKEAESLYPYRHLNALQTVGYRDSASFSKPACIISSTLWFILL